MGVEVLLEGCGWPGPVVDGGFLLAEQFDVDGDRGEDVLDVGLGRAVVAAVSGSVLPFGQVTSRRSKSMMKFSLANPSWALACWKLFLPIGPANATL